MKVSSLIEAIWEKIPIFKNFSDDTQALLSYIVFVSIFMAAVCYALKEVQ